MALIDFLHKPSFLIWIDSQYSSQYLTIVWSLKHQNTQPIYVFNRVRVLHLNGLKEGSWLHSSGWNKSHCKTMNSLNILWQLSPSNPSLHMHLPVVSSQVPWNEQEPSPGQPISKNNYFLVMWIIIITHNWLPNPSTAFKMFAFIEFWGGTSLKRYIILGYQN